MVAVRGIMELHDDGGRSLLYQFAYTVHFLF